jgi:hypothetical protein
MNDPNSVPLLLGRLMPTARSSQDEGSGWRTWRDRKVGDIVNDSRIQGIVRVFGPGFCEELPSLVERKCGPISDNVGHPLVIR